jgi:acyl carrier protein
MGRGSLVGYVVPRPEHGCSVDELRGFLKQRLPEHMVPSALVLLEAIPLSPNGKVDRAALPAPESARADPEDSAVAPRTPTEMLIAEIWQEVLRVDQISVHDNFFDLGGHSLSLMRVIAEIQAKLGIRLSVDEFVLQTLGQIAAMCEERQPRVRKPEPVGVLRRLFSLLRRRSAHGNEYQAVN